MDVEQLKAVLNRSRIAEMELARMQETRLLGAGQKVHRQEGLLYLVAVMARLNIRQRISWLQCSMPSMRRLCSSLIGWPIIYI